MNRSGENALRWNMRLMAALTILVPLLLLVGTVAGGGLLEFAVISAILLGSLFLYRWDIVGYPAVVLLLIAYVAVAFWRGPATGGIALGLVALPWILLRWPARRGAIHLEFPLRDGVFHVAQGGRFSLSNYHGRLAHGQKYALDLTRLSVLGLRARGTAPANLRDYRIYGAPVYSPCSGTVASVRDGIPDGPPLVKQHREAPGGNCVWLQPEGTAVYVLLAHLQAGSIAVRPGDRIESGQFLGYVGNSGHTTEPHLHIHAQLQSPAGGQIPVPLTVAGRWLVRNSVVWKRRSRQTSS